MKFVIALALISCRTSEKLITDTGTGTIQTDQDGDGFFSTEDCNDTDPQVYPGAEEMCDGIDNNCDGQFDEGVTTTFYADSDADGYGNPDIITDACDQPSGYVRKAQTATIPNHPYIPAQKKYVTDLTMTATKKSMRGLIPPILSIPMEMDLVMTATSSKDVFCKKVSQPSEETVTTPIQAYLHLPTRYVMTLTTIVMASPTKG